MLVSLYTSRVVLNALGGEDIDEEDPYAEWGDHMYDRAAGK